MKFTKQRPTPEEDRYFETLRELDPSPEMAWIIDRAKEDLPQYEARIVRGISRVKGFALEPKRD